MTTKLGTVGILDILIGGSSVLFNRAVEDTERRVGKLGNKMGEAATAAALFGAAAVAAGAAVGAFVQRVADVADEAGKSAQKLGLTTESYTALSYAAKLADVSSESFSVGLRQLSKNMVDAAADTGDAKDAFKALGIEVTDANGKIRPTEDMLLTLAERFSGMNDGASKTALAMKIFGRSGADLIPFLNQGRAGIEELKREAERLGVVISTETAKAAEEFNDNLRRLQSTAQGVAMELGGPMVEALGKAAGAFLKARKDGEGFFTALLEGWRTLITGDDQHKWNMQFAKATEVLGNAEKQYQAVVRAANSENGQLFPDQAAASVHRYALALGVARAEVERLQKIKGIMFPEPGKPTAKTDAPTLKSDAQIKDEQRRAEEIRGIIRTEGEKREKLELEQIAKRNAQNAEAEAKFQQQQLELREVMGQREIDMGQAHLERQKLMKSFEYKSEEELENEAHIARMARLSVFSEEELAQIGGKQQVLEQMESEHQRRLFQIRSRSLNSLAAFNKASWQQQTATVVGELVSLTAGVAQHSRKMFEINKIAGIANAIVNTYLGVSKSLSAYPMPLAAAMAAAHLAAGMAQVQAIRATSFSGGGGGAAPSVAGSTPAAPVSPVGGGGGRQSDNGGLTIVQLDGAADFYSAEGVRKLMKRIAEATRSGGRIRFAEDF